MMVQSHLLGALLLGLLVARFRPMAPRDWALALGFAVAIDLDHLVQLPQYLLAHGGLAALAEPRAMVVWGAAWQGFMHTPWALALVVPACLAWRSWLPAAFWLLHMGQDFVVALRFVRFGSPLEYVVDLALLGLVGGLLWLDHRRHAAPRPFVRHVAATFGLLR